jgi:hypothetical protein
VKKWVNDQLITGEFGVLRSSFLLFLILLPSTHWNKKPTMQPKISSPNADHWSTVNRVRQPDQPVQARVPGRLPSNRLADQLQHLRVIQTSLKKSNPN